MIVSIGNGLFARTNEQPKRSLRDEYRRLQATCKHEKRDPRGMCYRCGDVQQAEQEPECLCIRHGDFEDTRGCPAHGEGRRPAVRLTGGGNEPVPF